MLETLPYYLILLIAAVPALTNQNKKLLAGWASFFVILLLFVGLRFQVGSDWEGYLQIADELTGENLKEVVSREEFLYYFVVWLSVSLGWGIYGANLLTTGIFLFGLFKFCRKQPSPWLALFSALPFLVIVIGMSANRQAAAIGVTLYLLARWSDSPIYFRLALVALAMAFHTSAGVFLLLFVLDGKLSLPKKVILAAVIGAFAVYYFASSQSLERYGDSYVEGAELNSAAGALQQIVLNAFPAVFIVFASRRLKSRIVQWRFIHAMALVSLALIPVALAYSVAAARLSFYLFPVSLALLSAAPEIANAGSSKLMLRYAIIIYGFVTLVLWLSFANHAYNHKPYGNLLFN